MMRVPSTEIKSDASSYIVLLQGDLTTANSNYLASEPIIDVNVFSTNLSNVISNDNDWIVEYYKTEIEFYKKYEIKRKKTADSLETVTKKLAQIEQKRVADSIAKVNKEKELALKASQKAKADSIAYADRFKGFSFVNVDELSLREKPSTSGKLLATLGVCSYVKILNDIEVDGYVYVKVGDRQGYVYKSYLVDNLDDITVEGADIETAKTKQIVVIETVKTTSVKYSKDSKGNCFYTNSAGKKIFVDRSYCD
jgi:hypothetical protein